jgi:hypothetical protein
LVIFFNLIIICNVTIFFRKKKLHEQIKISCAVFFGCTFLLLLLIFFEVDFTSNPLEFNQKNEIQNLENLNVPTTEQLNQNQRLEDIAFGFAMGLVFGLGIMFYSWLGS